MMRGWVVSREVVGAIRLAFAPLNLELALANMIADPIKAHVDGFQPFLFDGVSGNAASGIVIGRHGRGGLRVPHFFDGDA